MLKLIERSELEKILNSHHCNDSGSGDAIIESIAEHFGIEIKKEPEFIDPALAVSVMHSGKEKRAHFESTGSCWNSNGQKNIQSQISSNAGTLSPF